MTHTLKFILALLLLVGCQNEELISPDDNRPNPDGSVGFRLQIEGSSIGNNGSNTKGTPHDALTEYDSVRVNVFSHTSKYKATEGRDVAFFRDIKLEKESTNWNCIPPLFWPLGQKLSFFAYSSDIPFADAGISFEHSTGESPIVENILYKVPSDVNKQPDLLVSAKLDQTVVNNVSLTMKHALSCVSFVGTAPEEGIFVKSVTLRNVYSEGTLPLNADTIVWTPTGSKDATVFVAGIDTLKELEKDPLKNNNYLMTDSGYLMMIPQKLENPAIDVLYWNGADDAQSKITTYILPVDSTSYNTWKPGMKYIYKFGQTEEDITVVYYEKYADNSYGFQSKDGNYPLLNDTIEIVEAGYGVLSKSEPVTAIPTIKLGLNATAVTTVKINKVVGEYDLYTVSQTSINKSATFALSETGAPANVYFDGSSIPCGTIIPHFAKGVSDAILSTCAIRTPQQMQNISALTIVNPFSTNATQGKTFEQERDLDFSKSNIGGITLDNAVVDQCFSGTYNGGTKSISNLTISAPVSYVGLFSENVGTLNDITLKASSITGKNNVGGIAGKSYGGNGAINRPRIIGTGNTPKEQINITGTSHVGGIVGDNQAKILGNDASEAATEITVAEVSGWVNIKGTGDYVGGITGENGYESSIKTVLVNGVYVTGSSQSALSESKIVIEGNQYVGGIAGNNTSTIEGNVTGSGTADIKNMPDVAGIVEIHGTSWVGGITGKNSGDLNSVNIRLGRTPAMIIKGTGGNVGGIVGENEGTLGVESMNTFISTRGNIQISGANDVGGIVGKNSSKAELKNCFVYDFYNQKDNSVYYAPTIIASGSNVGGIAGSNAASITNCSVFSANKTAGITITGSIDNAGGLVGANSGGGKITNCSMVGKIQIEAMGRSAGGLLGDNKFGTAITQCWVGSSDGYKIIETAKDKLGLVITPPGVSSPSYGTPVITGKIYIGGIVGLNDGGIIEGVTLKDNITIGGATVSDWVGGIAGGNTASYMGTTSIIRNCHVENTATTTVTIQGSRNLGGVVGLNNGMVDNCIVLGVSGNNLKITGLGTIGGIVGQHGGHAELNVSPGLSGNEYTTIKNCHVGGFVTLQGDISGAGYATATEVGGIAGITGPNKDNVISIKDCSVGKNGAVSITVDGSCGGIVGTNAARIQGCDVYNATIRSTTHPTQKPDPYAGGIAGITITNSVVFNAAAGTYCSDINDCRVYSASIIAYGWGVYLPEYTGALVGYLNSDIAFAFGTQITNQVNSSGITVNQNDIPLQDKFIFGKAAGDGSGKFATIKHTVKVVPARIP